MSGGPLPIFKSVTIEIINKPLTLEIFGYSGHVIAHDYAGTAFRLTDKLWKTLTSRDIKNKGHNIWVYEPGEKVFAGVEILSSPDANSGLERHALVLKKYAYYKHVGPYNLIRQAGNSMRDALKEMKVSVTSPYIEIYGHWSSEESKLETELLMALA